LAHLADGAASQPGRAIGADAAWLASVEAQYRSLAARGTATGGMLGHVLALVSGTLAGAVRPATTRTPPLAAPAGPARLVLGELLTVDGIISTRSRDRKAADGEAVAQAHGVLLGFVVMATTAIVAPSVAAIARLLRDSALTFIQNRAGTLIGPPPRLAVAEGAAAAAAWLERAGTPSRDVSMVATLSLEWAHVALGRDCATGVADWEQYAERQVQCQRYVHRKQQ